MEAYSIDLRQRVLAAVDEGKLNRLEIARLFHVSLSWIRRLVQRRRETGEIAARQQRHGPLPKFTEEHGQQLREWVRSCPDATLAELGQRLGVGRNTVWRALKKLGLTLKKSRCGPANRSVPMCNSNVRSFVPSYKGSILNG